MSESVVAAGSQALPVEQRSSSGPTHAKIRLVYRVDSAGNVCSFIHVERRQAERILKIFKVVKDRSAKDPDAKVSVEEMCKALGTKNKVVIQKTANLLAGVLWIDVPDGAGTYKRLVGTMVDVRKGMYHKKRNLPGTPKYLKGPYFFVAARA